MYMPDLQCLCTMFASIMTEYAVTRVGKMPAFKRETDALQKGWRGRGAYTKFQAAYAG